MRSWDWDQCYSATESVWGSEPNPLPGRGGGRASGRPGVGPRVRRGAQRGLAGRAGLDKARRLAAERGVDVDWIHADLLDDQPPEAAFDLVMRLYLHLPSAQRRRVLEKAAVALAPAAMLLVIGHDRLNHRGMGRPSQPAVALHPGRDRARTLWPADRASGARVPPGCRGRWDGTGRRRAGPRQTAGRSRPVAAPGGQRWLNLAGRGRPGRGRWLEAPARRGGRHVHAPQTCPGRSGDRTVGVGSLLEDVLPETAEGGARSWRGWRSGRSGTWRS